MTVLTFHRSLNNNRHVRRASRSLRARRRSSIPEQVLFQELSASLSASDISELWSTSTSSEVDMPEFGTSATQQLWEDTTPKQTLKRPTRRVSIISAQKDTVATTPVSSPDTKRRQTVIRLSTRKQSSKEDQVQQDRLLGATSPNTPTKRRLPSPMNDSQHTLDTAPRRPVRRRSQLATTME